MAIFVVIADAQSNDTGLHTVVIDAGHGGKDPGAVGRMSYEKNIVLSVALRLGAMIETWFPDVKVIYTRNRDYFVPLAERSDIANQAKADLFISIHANSVENNRTAIGCETYIMGLHRTQENLEIAMRENSVISMETDQSAYEGFDPSSLESYIVFQLMQNAYLEQSLKMADYIQDEFLKDSPVRMNRGIKQAGFVVLYRTAAPSVLVELGFISNIVEEKTLMNPDNQQQMAECIFRAFKRYKTGVDAQAISLKSDTIQDADVEIRDTFIEN
ncbi:MAG: N-acetylmuramoyl-L-alanine amidase [Prevotellaceae bacterium]|nr:N-acetylmuramoyl-L-alanine amidase [Prevotellaceae bacterium]